MAVVNSVKEVKGYSPTMRVLIVSATGAASRPSGGGDSVDLSAYTDRIFGVYDMGAGAKTRWFSILTTNFGSGKLDLKAFSAAAAVATSVSLASVTSNLMVFCRQPGSGCELVTIS